MTYIFQGETLPLSTTVVKADGTAEVLTNAICEFWLQTPDGEKTTITPTVLSNVVSVALTSTHTAQVGMYKHQFTITLNGTVDKRLGVFKVNKAVT